MFHLPGGYEAAFCGQLEGCSTSCTGSRTAPWSPGCTSPVSQHQRRSCWPGHTELCVVPLHQLCVNTKDLTHLLVVPEESACLVAIIAVSRSSRLGNINVDTYCFPKSSLDLLLLPCSHLLHLRAPHLPTLELHSVGDMKEMLHGPK